MLNRDRPLLTQSGLFDSAHGIYFQLQFSEIQCMTWWTKSKFAYPLMILATAVILAVTSLSFVEVTVRNFNVECGQERLDGRAKLYVVTDDKTYIGMGRHDNCEEITSLDAKEAKIIFREDNLVFAGLSLDGKTIVSRSFTRVMVGVGVFSALWLGWNIALYLAGHIGK